MKLYRCVRGFHFGELDPFDPEGDLQDIIVGQVVGDFQNTQRVLVKGRQLPIALPSHALPFFVLHGTMPDPPISGEYGTAGVQGPMGVQGPFGFQGSDGLSGTQGVQGFQGPESGTASALVPGGETVPLSLQQDAYSVVTGVSTFKSREICVQSQYAYVVAHALPGTVCFAVFDVSDPASPEYVGGTTLTLDGNNATLCNCLYVRGNFAYVGRNGGRLVVVDVSDPSGPSQRGDVHPGGCQIFGLDAAGGYVLLADACNGFHVVDVSDPDDPRIVGQDTSYGAGGVAAYGGYGYVTDYGNDLLKIYDLTDPSSPSLVGSGAVGSFPVVFHAEDRYVYVVEYGGTRVEIVDCVDRSNPTVVSTFNTQYGTGSYGTPMVVGDYLYISCGSGANCTVEVWDVSEKTSPVRILSLTGITGAANIAHPFVDGSAIFLPAYTTGVDGGMANVCNRVWSFLNLRLGDITVGRVNGKDRSVFRDLDVVNDATIGGNLQVANIMTSWVSRTYRWKLLGQPVESSTDIDFAASASEDADVDFGSNVAHVIQARLYIDVDPGGAFSQTATLSFYSHSDRKDDELIWRADVDLVLTNLDGAASAGDPDVDLDDASDLAEGDLVAFLDDLEFRRCETIAANNVTLEDSLENDQGDGTGVSRVVELGGFSVFDDEGGGEIHVTVSFAGAQTVSTKLVVTAV